MEGLEGLSIGRLATELEMSKSGLFAHFGSKEELQITTVRAAAAIFAQRVVAPAHERARAGHRAACTGCSTNWLDYMEHGTFDGGCFFAAATARWTAGRARCARPSPPR